ncbi:MAG: IPExxxVDY family protein [Moheibacter sp.]
MAAKTLLIDESEFIDFQLYGIATAYSDPAQFIYNINLNFHTRFRRIKDLDVLYERQIAYYPIYEWEDEEHQICYHIVKNAAYILNPMEDLNNLSNLFDVVPDLIPQHTAYNYFLRICPDGSLPLRENTFLQKITRLEPTKIKTINRLVF